ncbi:MAG: DUF3108 domain-containing protein [Flavobacteriaceae bacterium]|nr:DUF3108 domain-containing protein [Flavobacteriaceae bacterium]
MKKVILVAVVLMGCTGVYAQPAAYKYDAFKAGEWFKFRIHYGIFNASFATLHLKKTQYQGKTVYHAQGRGSTTGLARLFFKVDDLYESYFDTEDGRPYMFNRDINEGGYTKHIQFFFDHEAEKAKMKDLKHLREKDYKTHVDIQDLISAFYYLRNNYNGEDLKVGQEIKLDMLFDDDGIFQFKLRYLGKEVLRSKFGKVECLKFRPYVQEGFIFKEQESLTLWVSNDENKIPIRIQADLRIGSLKADLHAFSGLKNQFKIKM